MTTVVNAHPDLPEIVRTIVERFEPRRIVLFGSRVRGDAREDSDFDLLVEMDGTRRTPGIPYDLTLYPGGPELDIHRRTPTDIEAERDDPGLITYDMIREGKLLYQRPDVTGGFPPPRRVREAPKRRPASVELWIRRAQSDLRVMEQSMAADDPVSDAICFHAHAAVEKLLKATLVAHWLKPPRIHSSKELLARAPATLRDDRGIAKQCRFLDRVLTLSSYPYNRDAKPRDARVAAYCARHIAGILLNALQETA